MTEFHEYPKHVYPDSPDGSYEHATNRKNYVNVFSEKEEAEALNGRPVIREQDERKRLVEVARVKEVPVDGRWKLDRLRQTIADAGHDPDLNPFE